MQVILSDCFDPGIFSIGDTVCHVQDTRFEFEGIPTFRTGAFRTRASGGYHEEKAVRQRNRVRSPRKVPSRSSRSSTPVWKRSSSAW